MKQMLASLAAPRRLCVCAKGACPCRRAREHDEDPWRQTSGAPPTKVMTSYFYPISSPHSTSPHHLLIIISPHPIPPSPHLTLPHHHLITPRSSHLSPPHPRRKGDDFIIDEHDLDAFLAARHPPLQRSNEPASAGDAQPGACRNRRRGGCLPRGAEAAARPPAAASAGDCLFFSSSLLHASHRNIQGSADRWALISTYRDASIPDASKVLPPRAHSTPSSPHPTSSPSPRHLNYHHLITSSPPLTSSPHQVFPAPRPVLRRGCPALGRKVRLRHRPRPHALALSHTPSPSPTRPRPPPHAFALHSC